MTMTATALLRGIDDSKLDQGMQSFLNGLSTSTDPDALLTPAFLRAAQPLTISIYGSLLDDAGNDMPGISITGTSNHMYTASLTLRGLHDASHHPHIRGIWSSTPKP